MPAYYNERDPYAAEWLRNLIDRNLIAPGHVDERDIATVRPADLDGYDQHHFFAGIGVWSYALRTAGWPDGRSVWTGSCPCQPFSNAGQGREFDDARHVWPSWYRLICERRPVVVLGEQVASRDALAWFDHVAADLEAAGYTVGAVDSCAAGVGAPHIRQRLYFAGIMGDAFQQGSQGLRRLAAGMADSRPDPQSVRPIAPTGDAGAVGGFWSDAEWLRCADGRERPAEPGTFPLANGTPARVGRLRAYGNALVAGQAAAFIAAVCDIINLGTTT